MDASARGSEVREVFVGLSKLWWLWLVFGFIWILIALLILQFDQASITTVGVLIGAMFLATGVQQFVIAGLVDGVVRWVLVFFGVLLVIAGVIALISPKNTFAGIADVLGFLFLIVGIFWIVQAFGERGMNEFWWSGLISGVAMIARVLDGRTVLHREGLRAAGLRRDLGALPRRERHLSGLPDPGSGKGRGGDRSTSTGTSRLERDDRVDLHVRALGQPGHGHGHPRGRALTFEELLVGLVHARKVAHVGQIDRAADGVGQRRAGRLAHGGQVLQATPRLALHVLLHELPRGRVERNLPGAEEQVSGSDGLRIGADGGWCVVGGDCRAVGHGA